MSLLNYFQNLAAKRAETKRRVDYRISLVSQAYIWDPQDPRSLKAMLLAMLKKPDEPLTRVLAALNLKPQTLYDELLIWSDPMPLPREHAMRRQATYWGDAHNASRQVPLNKMPRAGPAGVHVLLALARGSDPISAWLVENGVDPSKLRQAILDDQPNSN